MVVYLKGLFGVNFSVFELIKFVSFFFFAKASEKRLVFGIMELCIQSRLWANSYDLTSGRI